MDMQHYPYRPTSPVPFEGKIDQPVSPPPSPPQPCVMNVQGGGVSSTSPQHFGRGLSAISCDGDAYRKGYFTPISQSPVSFQGSNTTPSPLRNAMNDVMTSLRCMGLPKQNQSPKTTHDPAADRFSEVSDEVQSDPGRLGPDTLHGIGILDDGQLPTMLETQHRSNTVGHRPSQSSHAGYYVQNMDEPLCMLGGGSLAPRPKNSEYQSPQTFHDDLGHESTDKTRSQSSVRRYPHDRGFRKPTFRHRISSHDKAKQRLSQTSTTKTNATNSTEATDSAVRSVWSPTSAGAVCTIKSSSFARRKPRIGGILWERRGRSRSVTEASRPCANTMVGPNNCKPVTPFESDVPYTLSDSTRQQQDWSNKKWTGNRAEPFRLLGGLTSPKPRKSEVLKRMISTAKANAANVRNTLSSRSSRQASRGAGLFPNGVTSTTGKMATSHPSANVVKAVGVRSSMDWIQVRRDVNRSNSLSMNERIERAERCQMNGIAVINPIEVLQESIQGDEGLDGLPIDEPIDSSKYGLTLVDKNSRFIQGLSPMTTPASLAQRYLCRPYHSDVQRLRAIFTWVAERIVWEDDFEGDIDTRRVIRLKRGCSEEIAVLFMEMCTAVGLHAEVIRGYLKAPGEMLDYYMVSHPNHWWNAVIVEGKWRIVDCSLANPTNPRRSSYSSAESQVSEGGFFLARPSEICYTHVPLLPESQHIAPPLPREVLIALPCACPSYFVNGLEIADFDTSLLILENLEMTHLHFFVPDDVEAVAEVEARAFVRDGESDYFESGDVCRKRALCQPEWIGGRKRYTIKAVLPGDEGHATLKVFCGKRGLMHSITYNPHPVAFALPLTHTGQNPPYDFVTIHPTPFVQGHDLYVAQPQCAYLAVNNTFVFAVRQHPSSLTYKHSPSSSSSSSSSNQAPSQSANSTILSSRISPIPTPRPTSTLRMVSASPSNIDSVFNASFKRSESQLNHNTKISSGASQKPAKLAIQSPSGKIIRLMRKDEHMLGTSHGAGVGGASEGEREGGDGSVWETIIKVGERGTWRGLVLADQSAMWCVLSEWECF